MNPRPVGIGFESGRKPPNNAKMRSRWPPPAAAAAAAAAPLLSPTLTTKTTTTATVRQQQQQQQNSSSSNHWSSPRPQMSALFVLLLAIAAIINLDSFVTPTTAILLAEARLQKKPTGYIKGMMGDPINFISK